MRDQTWKTMDERDKKSFAPSPPFQEPRPRVDSLVGLGGLIDAVHGSLGRFSLKGIKLDGFAETPYASHHCAKTMHQ